MVQVGGNILEEVNIRYGGNGLREEGLGLFFIGETG